LKETWLTQLISIYLNNLACYFKEQAKDEMIKETLLEAVSNKKIVFQPQTEKIFPPSNDQVHLSPFSFLNFFCGCLG
jgi:hypothetical protein